MDLKSESTVTTATTLSSSCSATATTVSVSGCNPCTSLPSKIFSNVGTCTTCDRFFCVKCLDAAHPGELCAQAAQARRQPKESQAEVDKETSRLRDLYKGVTCPNKHCPFFEQKQLICVEGEWNMVDCPMCQQFMCGQCGQKLLRDQPYRHFCLGHCDSAQSEEGRCFECNKCTSKRQTVDKPFSWDENFDGTTQGQTVATGSAWDKDFEEEDVTAESPPRSRVRSRSPSRSRSRSRGSSVKRSRSRSRSGSPAFMVRRIKDEIKSKEEIRSSLASISQRIKKEIKSTRLRSIPNLEQLFKNTAPASPEALAAASSGESLSMQLAGKDDSIQDDSVKKEPTKEPVEQ